MTKIEKRVLAWVNRQRAAMGIGPPLDGLPKGQRNHCFNCPIGKALCAEVDDHVTYQQWTPGEVLLVAVPEYVQNWITAFDHGEYPHLVSDPV